MDNQFEELLDRINESDEPATNREEDLADFRDVRVHPEDKLKPKKAQAVEADDVDEANMFTADKIESLEAKIAELDKLAKGCRKGPEQSSIYARIDALEAELTQARMARDASRGT